jgi:hypothetical protein
MLGALVGNTDEEEVVGIAVAVGVSATNSIHSTNTTVKRRYIEHASFWIREKSAALPGFDARLPWIRYVFLTKLCLLA